MSLTQLDIREFDTLTRSGWGRYEPDAGDEISTDESAEPYSPSTAYKAVQAAGTEGGSGPVVNLEYAMPTNKRAVQVVGAIKVSSAYAGHPGGTNKKVWMYPDTTSPAGLTFLNMQGDGITNDGTYFYPSINNQGVGDSIYTGTVAVTRNVWWRYRIQILCNTPGSADGAVKLWIAIEDGAWTLAVDETGVEIVSSGAGDGNWAIVSCNPLWGGGGSTIATDQYVSYGHIDIQTADALNEFTDPALPGTASAMPTPAMACNLLPLLCR